MKFQSFLDKNDIAKIPLPTPFPVGPVNTYLIKGDALTLVDTGLNTDESYDELVRQLKEHSLTVQDLDVIIATHGHRDHMGLLGRLLRDTDAKAYGHPLVNKLGLPDDDFAVNRKAFFIGILHEFGVPNDIIEEANSLYERFRRFSEPYQLDYFFEHEGHSLGFDTYFVPGHSPSDTLFVDEERGFTIVADHILTNTSPNPLLRRPDGDEPRAKSMVEYQASLRESRERNLGICLPGHGNLFDDHVKVIDRIFDKHRRREEIVLNHIKHGRTTPYSISKKLFPRLPAPHMHLGLSVSVGHLEVLEEQGKLLSSHSDGILNFSLA
ncbi:MAG: MBL fold metallo-hydrolase [Candidatus Hydrogenedentota bacterium]